MTPEALAISLAITLVFYVSANILNAFTVREYVKIPWYVIVIAILLETVIHVYLRSIHWLLSIPFVYLCTWVYCKAVDVEPIKLLYIQLINVTHQVVVNDFLYLLEGSSYTWGWSDFDVVLLVFSITTPIVLWFLRMKVWPRLKVIRVHGIHWIWIIPMLFITLNLLLGSSHLQYLLDRELAMPYVLMTILFSLTTAATSFLVLHMLERSSDVANYEANLSLMDMQMATEAKRFAELTQYMDAVRTLRHDMRHHLIVMQMLLGEGQYEKLGEYLDTYTQETKQLEAMRYSDNFIGDLVARRTQMQAESAGIEAEIICSLPADCWISDTDLSVVLGNLTENAIHACRLQREGTKFMRATAKINGNEAIIALDNSCNPEDDTPAARAAAGVAPSTGRGIPSIQSIARKYGGTAVFEKHGGMFRSVVLLYKPSSGQKPPPQPQKQNVYQPE